MCKPIKLPKISLKVANFKVPAQLHTRICLEIRHVSLHNMFADLGAIKCDRLGLAEFTKVYRTQDNEALSYRAHSKPAPRTTKGRFTLR